MMMTTTIMMIVVIVTRKLQKCQRIIAKKSSNAHIKVAKLSKDNMADICDEFFSPWAKFG